MFVCNSSFKGPFEYTSNSISFSFIKSFILTLIIVAALATMTYVWVLYRRISKIKVANGRVAEISSFIESGAMAFLKREYKVIIPFIF